VVAYWCNCGVVPSGQIMGPIILTGISVNDVNVPIIPATGTMHEPIMKKTINQITQPESVPVPADFMFAPC
jgi:hypothetical protein